MPHCPHVSDSPSRSASYVQFSSGAGSSVSPSPNLPPLLDGIRHRYLLHSQEFPARTEIEWYNRQTRLPRRCRAPFPPASAASAGRLSAGAGSIVFPSPNQPPLLPSLPQPVAAHRASGARSYLWAISLQTTLSLSLSPYWFACPPAPPHPRASLQEPCSPPLSLLHDLRTIFHHRLITFQISLSLIPCDRPRHRLVTKPDIAVPQFPGPRNRRK